MPRVFLFGQVRFAIEDRREVPVAGEPAQRLLAWLALEAHTGPGGSGPAPRSRIVDALWAGSDAQRPDNSLRQALRMLRATTGPHYELLIEDSAGGLGLRPDVWVDAAEFDRLAADDPAEALRLSDQPFLETVLRSGTAWDHDRRSGFEARRRELRERTSGRGRPSDRMQRIVRLRVGPVPAIGVVALAAVAAAVSAVFASGGDGERAAAVCPPALTQADPADARVVDRKPPHGPARPMEPVDVGTRPAALAVAKEGIFVAERQGVTLIDPRTNAESGAVTTVTTGGPTPENAPFSIAVTRDRLWMARRDGFLVSIDRRTRELVGKPVRYGTGAGTVTTAAGSVWVNNFHDAHAGSLARVNPCTGAVTRVKVGREANSVVPGFGSLWVTDSVDSALKRIDPVTGSVVASIGGLDDPQDVLPAFGRVWVAEYDKKALREIDPRTNRIVGRRIPIGSDPAAIAAGAGALWIPLYGNGSITRVDPHTRRSRLGAASAGTSPTDTVVAFGRLWAPNNDGDTVTPVRIP